MLELVEHALQESVIKNLNNASVSVVETNKLQISSEKTVTEIQDYSNDYLLEMKAKYLMFLDKINERIKEIDTLLGIIATEDVGAVCAAKAKLDEKILEP